MYPYYINIGHHIPCGSLNFCFLDAHLAIVDMEALAYNFKIDRHAHISSNQLNSLCFTTTLRFLFYIFIDKNNAKIMVN